MSIWKDVSYEVLFYSFLTYSIWVLIDLHKKLDGTFNKCVVRKIDDGHSECLCRRFRFQKRY